MIIDEDSVYDPKLTNDRQLLGMKGTFSELELKGLWVERSRWFGDVYLALAFVARGGARGVVRADAAGWQGAHCLVEDGGVFLVAARLCEPSSELHIAEDWYRLADLADDRGHDGGPARNAGAGLDH